MRKILFATERVYSGSAETVNLIGVLVVLAVIASSVVLYNGLGDPNRNQFKLLLHCVMIVTSVIPPELPMELSLAVTMSLAALSKLLVYCTEPFRIPFAGRLDVLCFDKTGTLTQDKLVLKGVVAPAMTSSFSFSASARACALKLIKDELDELPLMVGVSTEPPEVPDQHTHDNDEHDANAVHQLSSAPDVVLGIVGCCHSLIRQQANDITGDPLELAAFSSSGCRMDSRDIISHEESGCRMFVLQRYAFTSTLKRMSVLVRPVFSGSASVAGTGASSADKEESLLLFCKGAPEVLADLIKELPPNYHTTYLRHMSAGKRVLALAYKSIPMGGRQAALTRIRAAPRSEQEYGLSFAGFLIFESQLKPDSKIVINELRDSGHRIVIVTGDSIYTAIDVAKKLKISTLMTKTKADSILILTECSRSNGDDDGEIRRPCLMWRRYGDLATDNNVMNALPNDIRFDAAAVSALAQQHCLCVTGATMNIMTAEQMHAVCAHITIFARVSPNQKQQALTAMKEASLCTLMCGDGTNDVGALKAAHVGVSIINSPEFEDRVHHAARRFVQRTKDAPTGGTSNERLVRAMAEMQAQQEDPTIVKFGDASIASAFTSRRTSVDAVVAVIRQGRCTLVATIQVLKILTLNCLTSAYMMSTLYLSGLKQGDMQMTVLGLVTAAMFFVVSQSKPLPRLMNQRPPVSIFQFSVVLSVIGQFMVHLTSLLVTLALSKSYFIDSSTASSSISSSLIFAADSNPDGRFRPNIINTSVYLISMTMQLNNFVVNYRGHPFT